MSVPIRLASTVLTLAALAGCASVQVRSVGTNTGQPAFDLSGGSLAALSTQATQLCPQGHTVLRQWQSDTVPAVAGDPVTEWMFAAAVLMSYDLRPAQAQMTVVCRA